MIDKKLRRQAIVGAWLRHYHPWVLLLLWLGVQFGCWRYYHGPHLMGDGMYYVAYARQLLATGSFATGHYQLYAGYALFISLFLALGLGMWAIGIAQVVLSGLATVALYRTALRLACGRWVVAALVALGFISWVDVQQFNAFILTESLFTSLLTFCLWAVVRAQSKSDVALVVLLMLGTAALRPNGFIAIAAAGLAGCWLFWQQKRRVWSMLLLLSWITISCVIINKIAIHFRLLSSYAAGEILFGYPQTNVYPPDDLAMPDSASVPLVQLGWFVLHNTSYFSKLCALKALYFLGLPRPWYSLLHRVWVVLVLLPLYMSAVVSFARRASISPLQVYLASTILLQLGIIMLTTEDQNARFSAPLTAYWLQLAALGLTPRCQLNQARPV